jgi:hypothetical protein
MKTLHSRKSSLEIYVPTTFILRLIMPVASKTSNDRNTIDREEKFDDRLCESNTPKGGQGE